MKLFCLAFVAIGGMLILAAIWQAADSLIFLHQSVASQARITQIVSAPAKTQQTLVLTIQPTTEPAIIRHLVVEARPQDYQPDQMIDVRYLPEQPEQIKLNNFTSLWLASVIFMVIGLSILLSGAIPWYSIRKRENQRRRLLAEGEKVLARVTLIQQEKQYRINNLLPYVIYCQWHSRHNDQTYHFQSERIWFDPSAYIKRHTVTVYIDRQQPQQHYYVDLTFLPKNLDGSPKKATATPASS